jgi:hypothetical protein
VYPQELEPYLVSVVNRQELGTDRLPKPLSHPSVDTRVGTIELKIPKVTAGAYLP